jgi:hypothetical protein
MKWLLVFFLTASVNASSQCKTFIIGAKGDTLNCTDVKGNRQGKWLIHVDPIRLQQGYEEEGYFRDGKKEGTWMQYSLMGDLKAIENYRFGLKDGLSQYFNIQAGLIREERWKAVDPKNPYDTIDVQDLYDPKKFTKVRIKLEGTTLRHGTWKYYNENTGALVKTEEWFLNRIKDPNEKKVTDTASTDGNKTSSDSTKAAPTKARPKEVEDFEKKNSGKKKVKIRDGRTGG